MYCYLYMRARSEKTVIKRFVPETDLLSVMRYGHLPDQKKRFAYRKTISVHEDEECRRVKPTIRIGILLTAVNFCLYRRTRGSMLHGTGSYGTGDGLGVPVINLMTSYN